jgi:hypothetical protein
MASMTVAPAATPSRTGAPRPSSRPAATPSHGRRRAPVRGEERGPSGHRAPRPGHLAEVERLPPPQPRRGQDDLHETAGSAADVPRLRPSDRRAPGPHRHPRPLHRTRPPRPAARRPTSNGERRGPPAGKSAQPSPCIACSTSPSAADHELLVLLYNVTYQSCEASQGGAA